MQARCDTHCGIGIFRALEQPYCIHTQSQQCKNESERMSMTLMPFTINEYHKGNKKGAKIKGLQLEFFANAQWAYQ